MAWFTVNTKGNNVKTAKEAGCHAYYADGVTAIEIMAADKEHAVAKVEQPGFHVYYAFE